MVNGTGSGDPVVRVTDLMRTQISNEGGVVVFVDHEEGLARPIAVGDPSKCPGLEKTKAPAR